MNTLVIELKDGYALAKKNTHIIELKEVHVIVIKRLFELKDA